MENRVLEGSKQLAREPVLVGRDTEIDQLMRCLDAALIGNGTTVFIGGEAGIGKTSLVKEFLGAAKKKETGILCGSCLSGATVPYFPFSEAFNSYVSTTSNAEIRTAMTSCLGITGWLRGPEIAQETATRLGITGWLRGPETARESRELESFLTPEVARDRTFEATATAFLRLSRDRPVILFLDDLHWADQLSLALIHYVARRCRRARLLIIGTYRSEELVRSKEGELHPLEETMFSMTREDLLTKIELNRLKRDDFPELLRSVFHTSFDEGFVGRLYEETEGNPLFTLETLNLLVEEGSLSEREGQWVLTVSSERIRIPAKVHEVIIRRIARLNREERKLLDLAAVCGHSFDSETLSRTLALDKADVLERLSEMQRIDKLVRSIDSTFEFTHQKIQEVIYGDLQGELRRVYHLKTASCLEQMLAERTSDTYLAKIAFHYVAGGALERAFEYLIKLGEKAVDIGASLQALEHLNKALEATQETPSLATRANLAKIYKYRGTAWHNLDQRKKAIDDFSLMLQNAASINDELLITEAHYLLGGTYEPYFGEMDEAMQHLATAVQMARKIGNRPLEAKILTETGYAMFWGLETRDESRCRFEESSKVCKEVGDKVTEAANLQWLGMHLNWNGEFEEAKENFHKAIALAEKVRGKPSIFTRWCLSMALAGNGEYNEAISELQSCLQLARDYGFWSLAAMVLNTLGWIYHDLADIELAVKYNNEALEIVRTYQRGRASGAVPCSYENLAFDYLCKNDYEEAERYFREVENTYEQHQLGYWLIESGVRLGRGEIALAKGDYMEALKSAEDLVATHKKSGRKKYLVRSLKLKAEVLAKMGNLREAIALMGDALKLAQQVGNPPALWQTHHALGLLLEKHGAQEEAREHHAKAIALIEATAAKLDDPSLKNSLLSSAQAKAIRDANERTKPT